MGNTNYVRLVVVMWRMTKYENQTTKLLYIFHFNLSVQSVRQILIVAHMLKLHNKMPKFIIYVLVQKFLSYQTYSSLTEANTSN